MMENHVFTQYSKAQTEEIVHSESRRDSLRKIMKFKEDNEKDEILLDFYESFVSFCIKHEFTLEKISCSLSIITNIVQASISNQIPVVTMQESLKSLLKKHSIQRPPYSIQVFSQKDITALETFLESTYFKHYSLYSYGFTPHKDVIITTEKLSLATFPISLNLIEGNETNPETIFELKDFLPRTMTPKETKAEVKAKETEVVMEIDEDPVHARLNSEIKNMKTLIEERFKKQDEEIFAKIELLKK